MSSVSDGFDGFDGDGSDIVFACGETLHACHSSGWNLYPQPSSGLNLYRTSITRGIIDRGADRDDRCMNSSGRLVQRPRLLEVVMRTCSGVPRYEESSPAILWMCGDYGAYLSSYPSRLWNQVRETIRESLMNGRSSDKGRTGTKLGSIPEGNKVRRIWCQLLTGRLSPPWICLQVASPFVQHRGSYKPSMQGRWAPAEVVVGFRAPYRPSLICLRFGITA